MPQTAATTLTATMVLSLVVITGWSFAGGNDGLCKWASVYSSETDAWRAPTPNITNQYFNDSTRSFFIRDALYFTSVLPERIIIKYDLRKHVLSVIDSPLLDSPILMEMEGDDRGLGLASILDNCIPMWSWKAGINGTEEWVEYRVVELDTMVPKDGHL